MRKIILHIDLNAFFVRCEEIKNPSLENKPVVIGGDGRGGIVSTCSYEARKYGIHSGMPMFQAKMLCKNLIIIPPDFNYYKLMSKEFIAYVKKITPLIEQTSIDECYCDITHLLEKNKNLNIYKFLNIFQNKLFNATKLMCSIGVGCTKFIAKMGSDYKKPMGLTVIRNKDIPSILFPLPVGNYYGIGKKTVPRLNEIGIKTIGDLYNALKNKQNNAFELLGKMSSSIIYHLEGKGDDVIDISPYDQKSIGIQHTLPYDTNNVFYLKGILIDEFENIFKEITYKKKVCKTIEIMFKDANYDNAFKLKTFSKTLKSLTDNKETLLEATLKLFEESTSKLFKDDDFQIRLIGLNFSNLEDKSNATIQMTFDNYQDFIEQDKTLLLINDLNRKAKKDIFMRASDLKNKHGNN